MTAPKKNVDLFFAAYRGLETTLRCLQPNATVFDYENKLLTSGNSNDAARGDKLKVCRILRNYAQHNADGPAFVAASPAMIQFLDSESERLSEALDTVRKHRVMPSNIITAKTKISEASELFAKTGSECLPYAEAADKPISAILHRDDLIAAIAAGARLSAKFYASLPSKNVKAAVSRFDNAAYTTLNTLYSDVSENNQCVLITSSGAADGRYAGIVKKRQG